MFLQIIDVTWFWWSLCNFITDNPPISHMCVPLLQLFSASSWFNTLSFLLSITDIPLLMLWKLISFCKIGVFCLWE